EKEGLVDTGETFLGMFAGDHVKIGINTTISTGTVLGIFANITAKDSLTEKFIPDFYWTGGGKMSLEKAIEMAKRVMGRRGVKPDEGYIDKIRESYG
ncbi:MAG: glucose-1-phosphate thymidylyltransferase, partial [Candidatus Caldipriscus sp.]